MATSLWKWLSSWWTSTAEEDHVSGFSVENSGLASEQIRLARFTLKALGLDEASQSLTIEDLAFLCYSVGMNPPEYVIEAKLRSLGLRRQEHYTFPHFLHLWSALLENQDEEEVILERAFNFFDKDGNGEISTAEFKTTMVELGNLLSEAEIDEFLALMDTNNDGVIDYTEFIRLLKCQRPAYIELANKTSEDLEVMICSGRNESSEQEIQSFRQEKQEGSEVETAGTEIESP